ncbi:hypothetical protein BU17DRAFT_52449, partial [Hysterangium stoloniferum]
SNTTAVTSDPFLFFQPHFARSLPIQLLITGIVLTLTTTLLIQLCFTWQYHWPLARINWTLQFTGTCTLLINTIAILYVVLTALSQKSKEWPYMFEYIAIDVPLLTSWDIPEIAIWYVMEAATSALVSMTHIQFLTLLYPSRLEARLVFLLLGPLAIVASLMTLLPVTTYSNRQLFDIIDAARKICNLTLSFLFTLSLLIWGFLVNRDSAWRTDGATAAFGAGALLLACVSTGLNFLNVFSKSPFVWLPSLLWVVVLWQSFLGWWWWVGSSSGIASREFDMEKRGRKAKKRDKRKKRKHASSAQEGEAVGVTESPIARLDRWRSNACVTLSRRRTSGTEPKSITQLQQTSPTSEAIELTAVSSIPTVSATSSSPDVSSTVQIGPGSANAFIAAAQRAWCSIRQAHVRAERVQAVEQQQIQLQIQLENGRHLGRFPGWSGGEFGFPVLRRMSDDGSNRETTPPSQVQASEGKNDEGVSRGFLWSRAIKKWRLRDSTTY